MKTYEQYKSLLVEQPGQQVIVNVTITGISGEGWHAKVDNINGRPFSSLYNDFNGRSGWEAVLNMANKWKNSGFLD